MIVLVELVLFKCGQERLQETRVVIIDLELEIPLDRLGVVFLGAVLGGSAHTVEDGMSSVSVASLQSTLFLGEEGSFGVVDRGP